jgi:hypothetical protein
MRGFFLFTLTCCLGQPLCWASPKENAHFQAQVSGFQCTLFGEKGFKTWEIQGKTGHFDEAKNEIDVKGLHLKVFDGSSDCHLLATLESPNATLFSKQHKAIGKEYAFITTPQYTVLGKGWTWEKLNETTYQAYLHADVRVVFKSRKWPSSNSTPLAS